MDDDYDGSLITCEVAWILIQSFVSGDSTREGERSMRAHTAICGSCRDEYRAAVMTLASIGRRHRDERQERERDARRERLRKLALQASDPSPGKFHRMRTLLYPAFFAFLMFQVSRVSAAAVGASITGLEGQVLVREQAIAEEEAQTLHPGDRCTTGPGGSARIEARGSVLTLGPSSSLLVEGTRPVRFRLLEGGLSFEGSCAVHTRLGIVELEEARAEASLSDRGLEVRAESGRVQVVGAGGVEVVAPGAVFRSAD